MKTLKYIRHSMQALEHYLHFTWPTPPTHDMEPCPKTSTSFSSTSISCSNCQSGLVAEDVVGPGNVGVEAGSTGSGSAAEALGKAGEGGVGASSWARRVFWEGEGDSRLITLELEACRAWHQTAAR